MSELKKCPFCGGEAKHWLWLDNEGVYCTNCKAGIEVYGTLEELYNAWNTRTDGWISVKDELPEKNEQVMIYVKTYFGHEIDIARLEGKKKDIFRTLDVSYELEEVTHWQPLPEPPKGD